MYLYLVCDNGPNFCVVHRWGTFLVFPYRISDTWCVICTEKELFFLYVSLIYYVKCTAVGLAFVYTLVQWHCFEYFVSYSFLCVCVFFVCSTSIVHFTSRRHEWITCGEIDCILYTLYSYVYLSMCVGLTSKNSSVYHVFYNRYEKNIVRKNEI